MPYKNKERQIRPIQKSYQRYETLKREYNDLGFILKKTEEFRPNYDDFPDGIEVKIIGEKDFVHVSNLLEEVFIKKYRDRLTSMQIENLKEGMETFILNSRIKSLYFKEGNPVAMILATPMEYINDQISFHIGFVALHKKFLSPKEGELIKSHYFTLLRKANLNNLPYTARVDWYNKSSIKFFKKMGFEKTHMIYGKY